ncbi:MAG: GAF domain-containing protein, partial [Firmicutes bacterium]|nr:GAF domain-containing protein [Bacillota bacterium]
VRVDRSTFNIPLNDLLDPSTVDGRGPVGHLLQTHRPVIIQDITEDDSILPWREELLQNGIHAAAGIPLLKNGRLFGLLKIYHSHAQAFTAPILRRLHALAHLATALIEQSLAQESPARPPAQNPLFLHILSQLLQVPGSEAQLLQQLSGAAVVAHYKKVAGTWHLHGTSGAACPAPPAQLTAQEVREGAAEKTWTQAAGCRAVRRVQGHSPQHETLFLLGFSTADTLPSDTPPCWGIFAHVAGLAAADL